jgi:hypothetical protein
MRTAILCLALLTAGPVSAEPSQLEKFVQRELNYYNIPADVSQLAPPTVAALHLVIVRRFNFADKRRRMKAILRNAAVKETHR